MKIATFVSRHYTFSAAFPVSTRNSKVRSQFKEYWLKYCKMTGADPDYLVLDDINIDILKPGTFYRDSYPIIRNK